MKPKTIAIFSAFMPPHSGGVERYTEKLAVALRKLNYRVIIITMNYANMRKYEKTKNGIITYRLPSFGLFSQRYPIPKKNKEYRELIKKITNENIDCFVINTRFNLLSLVGTKLAKKNGAKSLVIEHGTGHFTVGSGILDFFGRAYEHILTRRLRGHTRNFYGVSKRCEEWLGHFNIRPSGVFYNAIDVEDYKKYRDKKPDKNFGDKMVIVYAGRIIKEKGVEVLLNAFSEIEKSYKNTILIVAGDGDALEELRGKYEGANVLFMGRLSYDKLMGLLNRADIFAHPSDYPEGLPTAILEAGLMNCAVVATDRGGSKEVIIDAKYGIIVDDGKDALRDALKILLNNPDKTHRIGKRLHERVCINFAWDRTAKKIIKEMEKKS